MKITMELHGKGLAAFIDPRGAAVAAPSIAPQTRPAAALRDRHRRGEGNHRRPFADRGSRTRLKDAKAEILAIDAGLMSRREAVASRGYDIEALDREIAEDERRAQHLGIDPSIKPSKGAAA